MKDELQKQIEELERPGAEYEEREDVYTVLDLSIPRDELDFCPHCHADVPLDYEFCPVCGRKVR